MPYDIVVRDGNVVDGSGSEPYQADVALEAGRIAAIGRVTERGAQELDAEGHVVTPGFIDGHTHMDAQLFWDPLGTCSCWHGVTTVVMGNCGFTLAPGSADQRELVVRNLERAEDISGVAMAEGIDWTWTHFGEYLQAVDRVPKGINYAAQVGHSALRTWAMGERAFDGTATEGDLAVMEDELRDALANGALGFTTSRNDNHETSDGRPVASRLASWDEVRRLVGAVGEYGPGRVFELASESPADADFYRRVGALAAETGVVGMFGVSGNAKGRAALEHIEAAAANGGELIGQTHSRGVSVVLSFRTCLPFDVLSQWKPIRELPLPEQERALRDPAVRSRLVHAAHHGDYGRPIGAEARKPDYELMQVLDTPYPPNPTVAELAAARGVDPVELIIDLGLESGFDQFFVQPVDRFLDEDLVEVMKHPRTVMTFSDSGAHVSQILDCSIQTHLLGYWVRTRGEFALEEAVRMLTSVPARAWSLVNRGLLREGAIADVNVFNPATVGPEMPQVVTDLPGGAKRLTQRALGFRATIIAGQIVQRDGEHTGVLPGRLVRVPHRSR
jgi:N-acyl-D-aspartate/D-glutamate deacylase